MSLLNKHLKMVAELEKNKDDVDFAWYPKPIESRSQKLARKIKENPFVPLGAGLTVTALVLGLINYSRGNQIKQQQMMRARVIAQGGTILAVLTGFIYHQIKKKE